MRSGHPESVLARLKRCHVVRGKLKGCGLNRCLSVVRDDRFVTAANETASTAFCATIRGGDGDIVGGVCGLADAIGIIIALTIATSAAFAAWVAIDRLLNPREISCLPPQPR